MKNVFADILAGKMPASVVYEDELVLAFMDIYPFARGHVLVIPKQVAQHVYELEDQYRERVFAIAHKIGLALRNQPIPCDDLNFLINDGRRANQSVPHVHMHVIPRVRGDGRSVLWQLSTRFLSPLRKVDRAQFDADAAAIAAALNALDQ